MRFLIFTVLVFTFPLAAYADDFGARFDNKAPAALTDESTVAEAEELQNIEPAAGENMSVEKELEQKFQTEVNSTEKDFGDGQIENRDVVGEGDVRVFYQSEQDGRVMDREDAIGVQMKVLEFE